MSRKGSPGWSSWRNGLKLLTQNNIPQQAGGNAGRIIVNYAGASNLIGQTRVSGTSFGVFSLGQEENYVNYLRQKKKSIEDYLESLL